MFSRPRTALVAALACLAGLAVTGVLAYLSPVARVRDSGALNGYATLSSPRLNPVLDHIAHLADPSSYGVLGLGLIAVALVRRRYRLAALLPCVLVLAPLTTELLKHVLAQPRVAEWLGSAQIAAASWPSGHATASMTLALCGVIASPAALRPVVGALGGMFALAVSFAILILRWHFPSDIVGGFFCAAMWTLLAVAVLRHYETPDRARAARTPRFAATALPAVALGAVAVALGLGAALARPHTLAHYAAGRPSFVFSVVAIGALAGLLAGVLVREARGPGL
jgi:membrane-associated phospholipid phosphatase